ncbi:hypothetical protein YC2023_075098 [Brassica napus]
MDGSRDMSKVDVGKGVQCNRVPSLCFKTGTCSDSSSLINYKRKFLCLCVLSSHMYCILLHMSCSGSIESIRVSLVVTCIVGALGRL